MATAGSSRDARRRRIMERGSDRLALITGRIPTLPSSSTSSESLHSHTASCPPSISQHLTSNLSDQLAVDYDFGPVSGQLNNLDVGRREEPSLRKCETRIEASRAPPLGLDSKMQPAQVSSALQSSSLSTTDTEHRSEPQAQHRKFFTPNQISSAIAASERTRTYFSVAAAILVVLSFAGFPILGSHTIKRIMFSRPLYLLLLTNISIVLSRLLLGKERRVVKSEKEAVSDTSLGGYGLADQLGKALESGLVLQNVLGAVFMDFSVYAVVLLCGLSLASMLGSGKVTVDSALRRQKIRYNDPEYLCNRGVLTPKSESVDEINFYVIFAVPVDIKLYKSSDTLCKASTTVKEQETYHELEPKVRPVIMLFYNPSKCPCNRTRLVSKHLANALYLA
ncbi:hypothetical protein RJ639_034860 [Escallonia herrerae]|uniref:Uncharacterized protein n=1 Tax=Escallonia herrerae TaxID=1293975 RepID=A0AA88WPQ7_9ASTE|nr:hypothetical protein RJ639_034860 [Escallonia herrerae]